MGALGDVARTDDDGIQLSRGAAVVNGREIEEILDLRTKFADFAIRSNETAAGAYQLQTGERGIALPDPIAMAILLEPALSLVASSHWMDVPVDSGLTRGMSVVDRLGVAEDARNRAVWADAGKHTVVWEMNVSGWKHALLEALQ